MKLSVAGVAIASASALLAGCLPNAKAPTAREDARAVVALVAHGVAIGNKTCADAGRKLATIDDAKARVVLEKCQAATVDARAWLEASEAAVDAWEAAKVGAWACLVRGSLRGVQGVVEGLVLAGAKVPSALEDGIAGINTVARFAAPNCSVGG